MNTAQKAIIKKDFHEVWDIKMARASILVVPLVLVIVLPAVLLAVVILAPEEISSQELSSFLPLLPEEMRNTASPQVAFFYFANMIFQPFFLMIPMMCGSIAAASSFVGEKERGTIENLLLTPVSVRKIFTAKVVGCSLLALLTTGISFVAFSVVMVVGNILIGAVVFPTLSWGIVVLLLCPGVTVLSVSFMVLVSAKAKTFVEAQQMSGFIVLPIILLVVGQATGVMLLKPLNLFLGSAVVIAIDVLLLHFASSKFTAEKLLK